MLSNLWVPKFDHHSTWFFQCTVAGLPLHDHGNDTSPAAEIPFRDMPVESHISGTKVLETCFEPGVGTLMPADRHGEEFTVVAFFLTSTPGGSSRTERFSCIIKGGQKPPNGFGTA